MRLKETVPLAAALAAIVIALSGQWFWSNIYFGFFRLSDALLAVIVVAGSVGVAAILLQQIKNKVPHTLLRALLILALIALVLRIVGNRIDGQWLSAESIPLVVKWLLLFIFLAIGWWAAIKWPEATWGNLIRACTVAGLLFTLSFPLIGWATRAQINPVFKVSFLTKQPAIPKNIVVLLLDETSPELAEPIIEAVRQQVRYTQASIVSAAGKSTVNAIPAMLTGKRFDEAMPCGFTTLCTNGSSLDFSQVHIARADLDIIGFHHPYCVMQGLRSCVQALPEGRSIIRSTYDLVCAGLLAELNCNQFVKKLILRSKQGTLVQQNQKSDVNKNLIPALFAAPFWDNGGMLYAHLSLPHPRGDTTSLSLEEEYKENMVQTAKLVTQVIHQLQRQFGEDFAIVITSDHPLRIGLWCTNAVYEREGCAQNLPENKGQVPLIIGSPKKIEQFTITENVGILN